MAIDKSVSTSYGSYNVPLKNEVIRDPKTSWDQDMFLKVLVAQMSNQDPMNPQTDNEFIGQMAQFSTLEQMQKLNTSFAQTQANSMVGKYIAAIYEKAADDGTDKVEQKVIQGKVDSVFTQGGITYVVINNAQKNEDGSYVKDEEGNIKYDTYKIPLADVSEVIDPSVYNDYGGDNAIVSKLNELIELIKAQQKTDSTTGSDSSASGSGSSSGSDSSTGASQSA